MSEDACRADVWLWRARFFKTRSLSAKFIEEGRVRLTRGGLDETRLDKASRPVKVGDKLVFAVGGRLIAVQVEAMGDRRGPPAEARTLYSDLQNSSGGDAAEQH
ncbi:RNA-binding S4 domain-containing protein [Phenylobacterium sp.]|jgi:ribosomal 50S subunit-recycling heat shock protein|uniref:RNA-binding S4 domain-containing protein n=1 Tax=Phenylobacterium sp. TaxID=1871053 RepID=UPI002F93E1D8